MWGKGTWGVKLGAVECTKAARANRDCYDCYESAKCSKSKADWSLLFLGGSGRKQNLKMSEPTKIVSWILYCTKFVG